MPNESAEISSPVLKTALAWLSVVFAHATQALAIKSWGDAAQFLAFTLTACYLAEWWWKRMWRPLLVKLGVIKS
jgi:hypothetical protein